MDARRKFGGLLGMLISLAVVTAACAPAATPGGSSAPGSAAASATPVPRGKLITLALNAPPLSLNPANVGSGLQYISPLYDSYIHLNSDGSFSPGLATEFGYVAGSGGKVFRMTLKEGLKFSDGSVLDAQDVVDTLKYIKGSGFAVAAFLGNMANMTAIDARHVEIQLTNPDAGLFTMFSEQWSLSYPICESFLKAADKLLTDACGIGPYIIDTANTIKDNSYVYLPNPNYYDQKKIRWDKMVIKVMPDENARIQALLTGQIQVMSGSKNTIEAARSGGMQIATAPAGNTALWLVDREGKTTPAMADIRVRQAMNYAMDRAAITKALVGDLGTPTAQPAIKGSDLYDPALETFYSYDVAKAKQLLSDAGYASGFSMTIVTKAADATQAQAVGGYLEKIGIQVKYLNDETGKAQISGSYPAYIQSYNGGLWVLAQFGLYPTAPANPLKTAPAELGALITKWQTADDKDRGQAARDVGGYVTKNAWTIPLFNPHTVVFAAPSVSGLEVTFAWYRFLPQMFSPKG